MIAAVAMARALRIEGAIGEVSRYVHLNPVRVGAMRLGKVAQQRSRAGLVEEPEAGLVAERLKRLAGYRWSSYRAYVGRERAPKWLVCEMVLACLGGPK